MKRGKKFFSIIEIYPKNVVLKKDFVKYMVAGLQIYDHRKNVIEEWRLNSDTKFSAINKAAVVQLVSKKDYFIVNLYDYDKENCDCPTHMLEANATRDITKMEWFFKYDVSLFDLKGKGWIFLLNLSLDD